MHLILAAVNKMHIKMQQLLTFEHIFLNKLIVYPLNLFQVKKYEIPVFICDKTGNVLII